MIGAVFLYNILKYIFTERSDNIAEVKNIIIKWAIALLAINFSRFALGAVIDLSTILTYSLWSMPLSILNQFRANEHDMPILSINTFLNYSNQSVKDHIYYQRDGTNTTINIPQCGRDGEIYKGFVTWPEYYSTIPGNSTALSFETSLATKFCAVNTKTLVDITALIQRKETNIPDGNISTANWATWEDHQYHIIIKSLIDKIVDSTGTCTEISVTPEVWDPIKLESAQEVQDFANRLPSFWEVKYCDDTVVIGGSGGNDIPSYQSKWKEWFIKKLVAPDEGPYPGYNNPDGLSLSNLLDSSKGMVWPFVTLYVTLLDFSNLSIGETTDENAAKAVWWLVEFFLRTIIGLMLMIPLIALAVALIVRVGIIWIIIAFMPIGIALKALDIDTPGWWDGPLKNITGNLNTKGVLWLIFAPVIPVFVLSISIIFIQALQWQQAEDISTAQNKRDFLGMQFQKQEDKSITCADFWWLQKICYKNEDNVSVSSVFADLFPWLFVNIFAIAIMWFLVKAAVNASPMTAEISWGIMSIWQKLLTSIPIVPIPGLGRVWLETASKIPTMVSNAAERRAENLDYEWQTRLEQKIASYGSNTPPPWSENTPPPRASFSDEHRKNLNDEIEKNGSPKTHQEIIEKITRTASTDADKEEAKRLTALGTGAPGIQGNDLIAHISELFDESSKEKAAMVSKVYLNELSKVANFETDQTTGKQTIKIKEWQELELARVINLTNIKSAIENDPDSTLKNLLKTLTYKDKSWASYQMGKALQREKK